MSKKSISLCQVLAALVLCLTLAAPALAAPAKNSAAKSGEQAVAVAPGGDKVHFELMSFGKSHLSNMNRQLANSVRNKEVKQNPDGSFTASYFEYDTSSLQCSYGPPTSGNKSITYAGSLQYCEVLYQCTAPTAEAARNGSFGVAKRKNLTELIPYYGGKWRMH